MIFHIFHFISAENLTASSHNEALSWRLASAILTDGNNSSIRRLNDDTFVLVLLRFIEEIFGHFDISCQCHFISGENLTARRRNELLSWRLASAMLIDGNNSSLRRLNDDTFVLELLRFIDPVDNRLSAILISVANFTLYQRKALAREFAKRRCPGVLLQP